MQTRKIYINDTERNNVITLETDATTFGEVKRAAIAAGVNVDGKDWLEGITKTTPTTDDSILPTNVSYKGAITNDLVFILTNTNKKIHSGAQTRTEICNEIKRLELQNTAKMRYNKHYTQCSNVELLNLIAEAKARCNESKMAPEAQSPCCPKEDDRIDYKETHKSFINSMAQFFINVGPDFVQEVFDEIQTIKAEMEKSSPKSLNLSNDEIRNMFK